MIKRAHCKNQDNLLKLKTWTELSHKKKTVQHTVVDTISSMPDSHNNHKWPNS